MQTRLLIDGQWRDGVGGKTFETVNPATEEVIAGVTRGTLLDIDLAVKAARRAFDHGPWSRMDARDRTGCGNAAELPRTAISNCSWKSAIA